MGFKCRESSMVSPCFQWEKVACVLVGGGCNFANKVLYTSEYFTRHTILLQQSQHWTTWLTNHMNSMLLNSESNNDELINLSGGEFLNLNFPMKIKTKIHLLCHRL